MKNETLTIRIIKPENEENWLTQSNLRPNEERIFSKEIYLAATDRAENYEEVTNDFKQSHEAEQDNA